MSLRPVDLQVLLPQVSEVNRNQPVQNQQGQTQQQQFAAQLQKQAEMQRQQIQESDKTEGSKIDKEARDRHHGKGEEGGENHKNTPEDDQKANVKDPSKGNLLDIKV